MKTKKMAFGGLSSDFGRTIERLREIYCDSDPIELLMLAAGQHCLNIKFHDILQDPKLHTFICSVEVGNLLKHQDCIGFGPTKKDAKTNAAQEAIQEITKSLEDLMSSTPISGTQRSNTSGQPSKNISRENPYSLRTKNKTPKSPLSSQAALQFTETLFPEGKRSPLHCRRAMGSPARIMDTTIEQNNSNNPIGELQELAARHGWPLPTYKVVDEYGPDHGKTFLVQCMFRDMITEGTCTTKKSAKRKSAEEMLKKIAKNGNNPSKKPTSSLVNSTVASLMRLVEKDNLEKLASTKGWTVKWHDLGKGLKGNSLCFVRVKTASSSPPTVCSGSGISKELARNEAARNALNILKPN